jgi:hypothetical protein
MGAATKRRRKITVEGHQYLWYVAEDDDGAGMVLHVISTDKQFIAKYQMGQAKGEDYIVILGRRFAGAKTGGLWRRFLCPQFVGRAVTPQAVRQLIEWCVNERLARREKGWRSHSLAL